MLDFETKRRIDTARDILVGKVPDPKSQVEQITIALIYRFMDDMDAHAEELGGKRKFFTGEFKNYGWAKLMAPSVSGEERIALYADGMVKMTQNPGVPQLFRNIFKNAFLPYRDPETLKLFLKTINEFEYDHSEKLGDAFEYLLSVLGSQGEAGQFRTPRHIIDFIVSIVDPKKNETVLDPACGTAGFLISAYKHILRANSTPAAIEPVKSNGEAEAILHTSRIPMAKGDKLTPDERKKLADNFRGYDISPDMVRLSLVNMYLHGFKDPHVFEYDTLTSQDRWNEMADVILANPPFMSPKGGIKPHNRFSVPSKRSEVLFVDYMAEHLTPAGRAGVIVPEGIIFQSQTAYKTLRKMLVEQYLVAVVSLPAGVFQPYSGVKTSILIFDRSLAKRIPSILFMRIDNEGTDLGARRKATIENDLPMALQTYRQWTERAVVGKNVGSIPTWPKAAVASREQIAANGEYNLTAERYRMRADVLHHIPRVPLEALLAERRERAGTQKLPVWSVTNSDGFVSSAEVFEKEIVSADTSAYKMVPPGAFAYNPSRINVGSIAVNASALTGMVSPMYVVFSVCAPSLDPEFLFKILKSAAFNFECRRLAQGAVREQLRFGDFKAIEIPLPPLEVQKEIVAEIEAYQKVIGGARAVLDHYRPHIPINPEWPTMSLGELCRFIDYRGKTPEKTSSGIPLITAKNVRDGYIDPEPREYIAESDYDSWMTRGIPETGDVLITTEAPLGNVAMTPNDGKYALAQRLIALCPNRDLMLGSFLMDLLRSERMQEAIIARQSGTTVYGIKASELKQIEIPLPPLAEQEKIVAEIEAEQRLVEANRQLIERMEKKIAATLARIWGEAPSNGSPKSCGD